MKEWPDADVFNIGTIELQKRMVFQGDTFLRWPRFIRYMRIGKVEGREYAADIKSKNYPVYFRGKIPY